MGETVGEFAFEALEASVDIMERVSVFRENAAGFGTPECTCQELSSVDEDEAVFAQKEPADIEGCEPFVGMSEQRGTHILVRVTPEVDEGSCLEPGNSWCTET